MKVSWIDSELTIGASKIFLEKKVTGTFFEDDGDESVCAG